MKPYGPKSSGAQLEPMVKVFLSVATPEVFSERLVPSDCVRISSNTAECIVPTPSAGTSNAACYRLKSAGLIRDIDGWTDGRSFDVCFLQFAEHLEQQKSNPWLLFVSIQPHKTIQTWLVV